MFQRFINRKSSRNGSHRSGREDASDTLMRLLVPVIVFIGLIWLVYLVSYLLPVNQYLGLVPRSVGGLSGIVFMPFLHGNFSHITSNTAALVVLMVLLVISRPRAWSTLAILTALSGICLWVLGRSANHIGASGLIYALMGFLIMAGIVERRPLSLVAAVIVGLTYGSVIFSGIIPGTRGVSWEGHLVGLLAGSAVAWLQFRKTNR